MESAYKLFRSYISKDTTSYLAAETNKKTTRPSNKSSSMPKTTTNKPRHVSKL